MWFDLCCVGIPLNFQSIDYKRPRNLKPVLLWERDQMGVHVARSAIKLPGRLDRLHFLYLLGQSKRKVSQFFSHS